MNKIIVNTIDGPFDIELKDGKIKIGGIGHHMISSSDARAIASALRDFADLLMIETIETKPIRDPHSLLLALVECMSTFADNDPVSIERTQTALLEYERSGDHSHGRGPIAPGGKCDGGDCWVGKVRAELAALKKVK